MVSLLDRPGLERVPFADALARHGSRLAIAAPGGCLSYAELDARVGATTEALGDVRRLVLIEATNQVDAVVAYLAALRGGHPALLVPGDRPTTVRSMVTAFDPDVVLGGDGGPGITERRADTAHDLHPELALLLCTSGSTGAPRLVRLSRRNVQANATAIATYQSLTVQDRAITSLPMAYCYGLSVINSHLATGAGLVLTDRSVVDACFWDQLRAHQATNLAGVPYTFDLLDRIGFETMSIPSLRFVSQAGGRLAPEHVQRYAELGARAGWELFVMYGQTEATARMAYLPPALAASRPGAIGIPIPGGSLDLEPVDAAAGEDEGELVYRGPNVMLGYAETPADLALGATVDALRTGDLARRSGDGLYEIVGRRSRFAKVFGLRIDLDHVESLLAAEGIAALCATQDDHLVVAVTEVAQVAVTRAQVQADCGLPPTRVVVVHLPELPRLPNCKPDHGALAAHVEVGASGPHEGGRVELDATDDIDPGVRRAFDDVLPGTEVAGGSTFVALGGDSLSYVEMSIALEGTLGRLPADWHTTALRDLRPVARPRTRSRQVETTVVLRALAIVIVVGTHIKLFNVLGGAHLLLGIAGYNFTRFQQRTADMVRSIGRIAVPSMVWLAVVSLLDDRIHLTHVLLLRGWLAPEDGHGGYWYIEAIVQILVPLVVLLAIPAVRRVERRHRLGFPMAVLAAGLLLRFHVLDLPTVEPHDIRAHDILWIFAIGWVAAEARSTSSRALLSALVLASVPGYFGEPWREVLVIAGLLLIAWVPTMALPRSLVPIVGRVAAASLYIYLTHWQVFPPLRDRFGPITALVGALAAGVAAWAITSHGLRLGRRGRQREARVGATNDRETAELVSLV